jgi:hypothetical protein
MLSIYSLLAFDQISPLQQELISEFVAWFIRFGARPAVQPRSRSMAERDAMRTTPGLMTAIGLLLEFVRLCDRLQKDRSQEWPSGHNPSE